MADFIKAIIFGIVEGVTEWLPISSTGHMIILNEIMELKVSKNFMNTFLVVIQLGAILAVVALYWHRIWPLYYAEDKNEYGRTKGRKITVDKNIIDLWIKIIIACVPAVVVGLLLDDWVDAHFYNWGCVSLMLILVGAAFIYVETRMDIRPTIRSVDEIDYLTAFKIGLFQVIAAIFPGTSRSGATIIGSLLLGVSRRAAAEFTFMLAIPVMFGASILKLFKNGLGYSAKEWFLLLVGMLVAFAVSVVVIRVLLEFIKRHNFVPFGIYRIVLGCIVVIYFFFFWTQKPEYDENGIRTVMITLRGLFPAV